ncbi:hypothetical protein [Colwellia sp. Bg11-28]|uniref:hypothetical protein n=1 Tax=Colwellia sp. Bg11-28 TaxID=2058305 RepID=UPI000C31F7BE|nr:hypothetical protein [Colwellia sp. Bg11-28]PKH88369.1 hypothetical protein CXF79_06315 [Colwellia sp. Bg11-28]
MTRSLILTESRLNEALERLLKGQPRYVKATGKLTLNKVNNEAKLGNSYIHKFPKFLAQAKPLIDEYNLNRDKSIVTGLDVGTPLSEMDGLKAALIRERKLKEKYRLERDNAIKARKLLEAQLSKLAYRVYELQENQLNNEIVVTQFKR